MLFSLLYMVLGAVLRLAPAGEQRNREVEILVLGHELAVGGSRWDWRLAGSSIGA